MTIQPGNVVRSILGHTPTGKYWVARISDKGLQTDRTHSNDLKAYLYDRGYDSKQGKWLDKDLVDFDDIVFAIGSTEQSAKDKAEQSAKDKAVKRWHQVLAMGVLKW